jgi:hypothetical protein
MIELSNLPENAIAIDLRHHVKSYVQPLFTQNWNLFAPTPVSSDVTVVARVKECTAPGACKLSPWFSISTPLLESVRRNRFSPLGVIQIMLDNAALEYHNAILKAPEAHVPGSHWKKLVPLLPYSVNEIASEVMLRTSAASIRSRLPDASFSEIQIALYVYEFPRFSHRAEPDRPERDGALLTLQWKPYPADIAPFVS